MIAVYNKCEIDPYSLMQRVTFRRVKSRAQYIYIISAFDSCVQSKYVCRIYIINIYIIYNEYGRLSDIIICHTCRNRLILHTYLLCCSGNTVIDAVGFFESRIKKKYKNKNLIIIINTGATTNRRPEYIYL